WTGTDTTGTHSCGVRGLRSTACPVSYRSTPLPALTLVTCILGIALTVVCTGILMRALSWPGGRRDSIRLPCTAPALSVLVTGTCSMSQAVESGHGRFALLWLCCGLRAMEHPERH